MELRHRVRLTGPQVSFDLLERGCHVLPRAWVPQHNPEAFAVRPNVIVPIGEEARTLKRETCCR